MHDNFLAEAFPIKPSDKQEIENPADHFRLAPDS